MFVVAFVMDRVAARLPEMLAVHCHYCYRCRVQRGKGCTIKTTVSVDVNINSPQMGQSHSVDRSMHRWEFSSAMDMHTPHFCRNKTLARHTRE